MSEPIWGRELAAVALWFFVLVTWAIAFWVWFGDRDDDDDGGV